METSMNNQQERPQQGFERNFNTFSNYDKLRGDQQRGINAEVELQIMARRVSAVYGESYQSEETQNKTRAQLREHYAGNPETVEKLAQQENRRLSRHPYMADRYASYGRAVVAIAERLDNREGVQHPQSYYTERLEQIIPDTLVKSIRAQEEITKQQKAEKLKKEQEAKQPKTAEQLAQQAAQKYRAFVARQGKGI